MSIKKPQRGQALVLVLLSLAVVLTIVLFILSRSITDISISSNESSSVSAFSAAEAGVERALVIGAGNSSTIGDASYNALVSNVATGLTSFIYPVELNSGDSITLWFHSQDASPNYTGNSVRICWGKSGTQANVAVTPAIEVSVIYETVSGNPATARVFRGAYDPNTSRRTSGNSFSAPDNGSCVIAGQTFQFQKTISLAGMSNPQFANVRMFYNTGTSQPVAFNSTNASVFPTQGISIDSSGTSGKSSRKVQVFQGWSEVPGGFQYAIYSPSGITK
jgi:Tfp pilus assembly protein PilX